MAVPLIAAVLKVGGAMLAEKAVDKAVDIGGNALKNGLSAMQERCAMNQVNQVQRATEGLSNLVLGNQIQTQEQTASDKNEQIHTM